MAARWFTGLPAGLIITLEHIARSPTLGPPKLQWDGVDFVYDPIASAVSGSNPTGVNIYRDTLGLGLSVSVSPATDPNATVLSVSFNRADGQQLAGTFDPASGALTLTGGDPGSVLALDANGNAYDPSGTNQSAGGTLGASHEITNILGSLDVHGNSLTLGSWMNAQGQSLNGLGLTFADASGNHPAAIDFSAARAPTEWTWSQATSTDGTSTTPPVTRMRLDAAGRLILYDPAHPGTPTMILDPGGQDVAPGAAGRSFHGAVHGKAGDAVSRAPGAPPFLSPRAYVYPEPLPPCPHGFHRRHPGGSFASGPGHRGSTRVVAGAAGHDAGCGAQ